MSAAISEKIKQAATDAVATTVGTDRPRWTRAELMQAATLTQSNFARLLNVTPGNINQKALAPETGFLYAGIGVEPETGRQRYAPWQVELLLAVMVGNLTLSEARAAREIKIAEMRSPVAAGFALPKRGRPRVACRKSQTGEPAVNAALTVGREAVGGQ